METPFHWVCPYCNHAQTVISNKYDGTADHIYVLDLAEGSVSVAKHAIGCSNPECRKLSLEIAVCRDKQNGSRYAVQIGQPIASVQVLPRGGRVKNQPGFIPKPLRDDYEEACLIRDLSPKAAATLVRRCLQGMIRDFCGISRGTLNEEIKALRAAIDDGKAPEGVDHASVDAIDAIRSIGNIGAHMERDINMIIEVDPDEAQLLIELVESLFDQWYVAREQKLARFAALTNLAESKKRDRDDQKAAVAGSLAAPNLALPVGLVPEGTVQSDIEVSGADGDPETGA